MMNEEKQKFIGGVDFDELRAQRVQLYNTIIIDLATARTNEEMVFTGNYIYALEATDVDANLDIRFNELFRAVINVKKGRGVRVPFYRFYITNTAQAGKTLTLAIGVEASDFEVFDAGKSLGITGTVDVRQTEIAENTPKRPVGSTQVTKSAWAVNDATLIYEVTAGKTLFLVSAYFNAHGGPATAQFYVIDDLLATVWDFTRINMSAAELINCSFTFPIPIEIPEAWQVKVVSGSVDLNVFGFIHGYEV